jgi:hypothetical protein
MEIINILLQILELKVEIWNWRNLHNFKLHDECNEVAYYRHAPTILLSTAVTLRVRRWYGKDNDSRTQIMHSTFWHCLDFRCSLYCDSTCHCDSSSISLHP